MKSNLGKWKLLCLKDGQMFSEHVIKWEFHPEKGRPRLRQISNTGGSFSFPFAVGKTSKQPGDLNSWITKSSKNK